MDLRGDDPNSNAMLVAIVYFVIAAAMSGAGNRATRGTVIDMSSYDRADVAEDRKAFGRRFPLAAVAVANGLIFIVLYFILNSRM